MAIDALCILLSCSITNVSQIWFVCHIFHSPRLSPAQYSLNSTESWPKTPIIRSTVLMLCTGHIDLLVPYKHNIYVQYICPIIHNKSIDSISRLIGCMVKILFRAARWSAINDAMCLCLTTRFLMKLDIYLIVFL